MIRAQRLRHRPLPSWPCWRNPAETLSRTDSRGRSSSVKDGICCYTVDKSTKFGTHILKDLSHHFRSDAENSDTQKRILLKHSLIFQSCRWSHSLSSMWLGHPKTCETRAMLLPATYIYLHIYISDGPLLLCGSIHNMQWRI